MASLKQLGDVCWLAKNYKYSGARKHVKTAEAMERKNSMVCGTAYWGTKYKEKHRQLTSKAIDINFARHVLIWSFVEVAIPCLDVSDSEVIPRR